MKPNHYLLVIVLALLGGFAGHSWAGSGLTSPTAEARAFARQETDEPRWEYCVVTKAQFVNPVRGGVYWIGYFRRNNVQVETVEAGVSENGLSKAVFKLGEEGWEMVGEGPLDVRQTAPASSTTTVLYFKRRRT
jgi:hypothetical protein